MKKLPKKEGGKKMRHPLEDHYQQLRDHHLQLCEHEVHRVKWELHNYFSHELVEARLSLDQEEPQIEMALNRIDHMTEYIEKLIANP